VSGFGRPCPNRVGCRRQPQAVGAVEQAAALPAERAEARAAEQVAAVEEAAAGSAHHRPAGASASVLASAALRDSIRRIPSILSGAAARLQALSG
jgi:hypothetical protein